MAFTKEKLKQAGRDKLITNLGEDIIKSSKDFVKVQNWTMGDTLDIEISKLKPFSKHQFVINKNKVEEYAESIREQGLHIPIIVWDKNYSNSKEYEILAGHHRVEACKLLGWEKIPAIIKKVDLPDAIDIVNYTNAMQRSFDSLGLYEKCAVINQMKENKELQESRKPELKKDEEPVGKEKLSGTRALGREFGVSKSLVSIYLILYEKMNKSQIELMEDKPDKKKKFDINTGLLLSKLPKKALKEFIDYLEENEVKSICKEQAKMILDTWEKNGEFIQKELNKAILKFNEIKRKNKPVSFKREDLRKYFDDDYTEEQIMQEIMQMLEERKG